MKTIVLMGIKHCGKSTQGKIISQKLGLPFYDTDDVITLLTGKTPREIYTEKGAEGFMEAEKNACEYVKNETALKNKNAVIATGGGICNNAQAVEILKSFGTLVYLDIEEKIATARVLREIQVAPDGSLSNMPAYIAKKIPAPFRMQGFFSMIFLLSEKRSTRELQIFPSMFPVLQNLETQTESLKQ